MWDHAWRVEFGEFVSHNVSLRSIGNLEQKNIFLERRLTLSDYWALARVRLWYHQSLNLRETFEATSNSITV